MKILILTSTGRQPDNRLLWEGLRRFCKVDIHFLSKGQQKDLRRYFSGIQLEGYDWIILDLYFKLLHGQVRFLRSLPRLVLYEEDACQEFIATSRWRGKFSAFYRKVPHARVIITGFRVSEKFRALGVDVRFLPKGYDSSALYDTGKDRGIPFGFIGRLSSDTYRERSRFLQCLVDVYGLQLLRTDPGDAYREALNDIRIFVSADIGLGEYMAKNFEAMACGCLLAAYRQGGGEEEALGLVDGLNVLLYGDLQEFSGKMALLDQDGERVAEIAAKGRALAQSRFNYEEQSQQLFAFLSVPPRRLERSFLERFLGCPIGV